MAEAPMLAKATHEHFVKNAISDGVLETNVLLMKIKQSSEIKTGVGGTQIGPGTMRARQHTIQGWGAFQALDIPQPDLFENWYHQWGGKIGMFYSDWWSEMANKGKPEAIFDLLQANEEALRDDFNENLEDSMFADELSNTPREWGGLAAFIKKTGTYGGLSQASGTAIGNRWKAQIMRASSSAIGGGFDDYPTRFLTALSNLTNRGKTAGGNGGFFITNRNAWNRVHNYVSEKYRVIHEKDSLKLGHMNFMWQGIPVFWSDSAPANKVYRVNPKYIKLYCQTQKLAVPLDHRTYNPIGHCYQLLTKSQLVCTNPRFQGMLSSTTIG